MPFPDGTSLGDILGDQPAFREIANRFTTEGVTSTQFAEGTQHSGTLKSLRTEPIDLGWGELALPGITVGIPFRLAIFDSPVGKWHLDLALDALNLKLRGLHGADFVKELGTTPRRLIRKQTDTAVVISGEATLRFARTSESDPVVLLFVENRSAADPLAATGAVVALRCNPPHFFFGSSQFGMTLTEHLFDASSTFSPEFIRNQGQGAEWMGFAIAEATFYAPPNAIGGGGFSGGVRNLLLGAPRGVQGELELQWGRAPLHPTTFVFTQHGHAPVGATGSGNSLLVPITAGQDDQVRMAVGFSAAAPPDGGSAVTDWQATWRWPDGSETTSDTSAGLVGHGQVLLVTPEEHVADRPVIRHPEISFRFVASGEVPQIDVITAGTSAVNAIHVSGPKAGIEALRFRARSTAPTTGTFTWKLDDGIEQPGTTITLQAGEVSGDKFLVLKETYASGQNRQSRLRVQVVEGVTLLIGSEDGVVTAAAPTVPLTPAAVEGTYDLTDFHAQGRYHPVLDSARLDSGSTEQVDVPDGRLAIVTIASGGSAPVVEHDRHVQIVFEFNKSTAIRWGKLTPTAAKAFDSEADLHPQLLKWASKYPGAKFLIVGRCDDLGSPDLNVKLAHTRRDTALRFLITVPVGSGLTAIAAGQIDSWGEQDEHQTVANNPLDDEENAAQRLVHQS